MTRRVIVCGGRHYADADRVFAVLSRVHAERGIVLLAHGACPVGRGGADMLADEWAKIWNVAVQQFPVDHAVDGPWPVAGPNRNARMLHNAKPDGVIAFPGDRGTADMTRRARDAGVPVMEIKA